MGARYLSGLPGFFSIRALRSLLYVESGVPITATSGSFIPDFPLFPRIIRAGKLLISCGEHSLITRVGHCQQRSVGGSSDGFHASGVSCSVVSCTPQLVSVIFSDFLLDKKALNLRGFPASSCLKLV